MTAEALMQAIIDAPDDDGPRVVYADFLEERGEVERAEFIRVQCELARLEEFDERRTPLQAREKELLDRHGSSWLAEEWPEATGTFQRGFISELSLSGKDLVNEDIRKLAANRRCGLLSGLDLSRNSIENKGVGHLAKSPYLRHLKTLDLRVNEFDSYTAQKMKWPPGLLLLLTLWGDNPVHGYGLVDKHPFSFQGQPGSWQFGVTEDDTIAPANVHDTTQKTFFCQGEQAEPGNIPHQEAVVFIRRCAEQYRAWRAARR